MTEANMDQILGQETVSVSIGDKPFHIKEITTRKLTQTTKSLEFFSELKNKTWPELMNEHGDKALDFMSVLSGIDKETLLDSKLSEMIEVVDAVLEANKHSFFLILVKQKKWKEWISEKSSNTSLKKATTSTT